jgi:translation initiation factor 4E
MIGEQFDYGDEICGAVVSVRGKQERIAIWTKNAANEAAQVLSAAVTSYLICMCDSFVSFLVYKHHAFLMIHSIMINTK